MKPIATLGFWETILSRGYRPFFLLAAIQAPVAMALFLLWIGVHHAGGMVVNLSITMAPHMWHAHEMLFGFTVAVVAGFFLTAVPSWTGTAPPVGGKLILVVLTWLAGRLALAFSAHLPVLLTAVLDLSLLAVLFILLTMAISKNWSLRNAVFLPIVALLFIANLLFHLEVLGAYDEGFATGMRLGLDAIILLLMIIGSRIVPAFTTNVLRSQGETHLPVSYAWLDNVGLASVGLLVFADLFAPAHPATGCLALAAAAANGFRFMGWQGHRTLRQPIVWILHTGFLWLVGGLMLKGLAILDLGISHATAVHALTAGAIGSMTLAVMTRAALGHTGRPLVAGPGTTAAYLLVTIGAMVRVAVPIWLPAWYNEGILVAGAAWMTAFALYAILYAPVLTGPRVDANY